MYRAKLPDELSASMICLPETVKKLKVKGDHVAMLPVASVLYVTGSKDDDGKSPDGGSWLLLVLRIHAILLLYSVIFRLL